MGFWEQVKELLRVVFFAWWNKATKDILPKTQPKYVVEYPPEYTREYFQNGFTDYRWNPIYRTPLNHLYNNDEKFKYKHSKYET